MQSSLGLRFDPAACTIGLARPTLPPFLDEAVLRNVALAGGSADILIQRRFGEIVVDVLRRSGGVSVEVGA